MSLLAQLNGARALVRRDPAQWPDLVRMIGPVADHHETEIRRWAASFLADFFGSEDVPAATKCEVAPEMWDALDAWLGESDIVVLKFAIASLSLVFPLMWADAGSGSRVAGLKRRVLALWDPTSRRQGVQIGCIKFAQVVITEQAQRPLPALPPGLDPMTLSAEAAGLLDRLLGYLREPGFTMQQLSATVNSVLPLARDRPQLGAKIFGALTSFDVSRKTPAPSAMVLRWVSKLFELQLSPFARNSAAVQRYIQGLAEYCANQGLKKRAAEAALDAATTEHPAKRAKRTLPPGEAHFADVFALVDSQVARFNARDLQLPLAVNMALAGLQRVDSDVLADCIDVVRDRLATVKEADPAQIQLEAAVDRLLQADQWWRLLVRLVTRGLDRDGTAASIVRNKLYTHVMSDFRRFLDDIVVWLSEEWYAAHVLKLQASEQYDELVDRILDQLLPRLEADDSRTFVRLLSELPEIRGLTLAKLRSVLVDPDRSIVAVRAIKFLLMFKPPARTACLDVAEDVYKTEHVTSLEPILRKYRPEALDA